MSRCVIVIHGVGETSPAQVGGIVANTLGWHTTRQTVLRHDDTQFVEFREENRDDRILEVHWADLMRPRATAFGILRHVWHIVTSMVNVGLARIAKGRSLTVRVYRLFVFPMTIGAGVLALATAAGASIEDDWLRLTVICAMGVVTAILANRLRRFGNHYSILWAWVLLIPLVLLAGWRQPLPVDSPLVLVGIKAREWCFGIAVLALTVANTQIWFGERHKDRQIRSALMALLYLPFIAMNGLMAWIGLLALSGLKAVGTRYEEWEHVAYPSFDLRLFELGATVAFSLLGLMFFVLTTVGFIKGRWRQKNAHDRSQPAATGARDGFSSFLRFAPIVLIALGIYVVLIEQLTARPADTSIIDIYRISVLRTLPFMAWLVGPFAIVADIAGDILFYLQPTSRGAPDSGQIRNGTSHPSAIGAECRKRLKAVYEYAKTVSDDVVVLAHSQGSKIAVDLRATGQLAAPLVTCGSPVAALYERFLGEHTSSAGPYWINAFRSADFIGGIIPAASENVRVGPPNGHTDYWSDHALPNLIERASASFRVAVNAG